MTVALEWNNPAFAFLGQTVEDGLAERPVRYIKFEQQTLLLCLFALDFPQRANKMAFGVP